MRALAVTWASVILTFVIIFHDPIWSREQNKESESSDPRKSDPRKSVSDIESILREYKCGRTDDVPCLVVKSCSESTRATIRNFKLTNTAEGNITAAVQKTRVQICHTSHGLRISFIARDNFIFSPYSRCNDPVFIRSDTLEAFIAPVRLPTDNPIWYWELDAAPTAALWVGVSQNPRGNASYCLDPAACRPGALNCTGRNSFAPLPIALSTRSDPAAGEWRESLFVPFALFAAAGFPRGWPLYRANFYRCAAAAASPAPANQRDSTGWLVMLHQAIVFHARRVGGAGGALSLAPCSPPVCVCLCVCQVRLSWRAQRALRAKRVRPEIRVVPSRSARGEQRWGCRWGQQKSGREGKAFTGRHSQSEGMGG